MHGIKFLIVVLLIWCAQVDTKAENEYTSYHSTIHPVGAAYPDFSSSVSYNSVSFNGCGGNPRLATIYRSNNDDDDDDEEPDPEFWENPGFPTPVGDCPFILLGILTFMYTIYKTRETHESSI